MAPEPQAGRPGGSLVILGASVRGFAESASRAGWNVYAADLFRDLDLVAATREAVRVAATDGAYPASLATAAARFPPGAAWCYTGGVENHPDLIAAVAATRPLAGTPAAVARSIRDPALVAAAVAAAGLSFPDTHAAPDGLPTDGSYLLKPTATAGGRGIRTWTAAAAASWRRRGPGPATHRWQRFVAGAPISASYVMTAGTARLIGVARQIVGADWCHAARFAWCGGVTEPRTDAVAGLVRLGTVLAATFHATGAVGVDAVIDATGRVHVLEINPRPTASMELFERATGISVAAAHLAACGHGPPTTGCAEPAPPPRADVGWQWAKAVLFARHAVAVHGRLVDSLRDGAAAWTRTDAAAAVADIPAAGQTLAAGSPVVTLFARARRPDDAVDQLRDRVAAVDRLLAAHAAGPARREREAREGLPVPRRPA